MPPVMLKVNASPSTSLADKLVDPLPSSSKLTSDIVASTGASFTASMVKVTISESSKLPSPTITVNSSIPLKLLLGMTSKILSFISNDKFS